ncbi:MAG: hypothetical protein DI536_05925 [Archangium gephyra]|uniref:site-specific DNA-methyltransferase (adenine-specific) n=1 Tax=Archangium gephyra TaxID=48 RepID=A0A2W5TPX5_9BACT|nr:MAG: hypothetical protein DI536_05925 [Archangium gephyra]
MNDLERRYHEKWLGLAQPIEGLVVSVPVLTDVQCMNRLPVTTHHQFQNLVTEKAPFSRWLTEILGYEADDFDTTFPDDLKLDATEGAQTLTPTRAFKRKAPPPPKPDGVPDDSTPASRAGENYGFLVWELPDGLDLDKPETVTGGWRYDPTHKFERLLRAVRVPIGLLFNGEQLRLLYAPHGESTGHLTFRFNELVTSQGRELFDAMMMLVHARRLYGVLPEHTLPAILQQSRTRQANVTDELAGQVFEALTILLAGFEAASERDGKQSLDDALARGDEHLYGGLLTTLLRLVFLLYAEDQNLMPVDEPPYDEHLSVKALYEQLDEDAQLYPDSMNRRFGAWPRLLALFRSVFFGASHGALRMPPRRGALFNPETYPFLEGWLGGGAPIDLTQLSAVRTPSVDDGTIHQVLHRLLFLEGQRLSYQALDVEQIGAVYEASMGYAVKRLTGAGLCLRGSTVWVSADEVLEQPKARRGAWLEDAGALESKQAKAAGKALEAATSEADVLKALEPWRVKSLPVRKAGQLVLQPGEERRRTSSHYTPRSLSAPIVKRTLEPLLKAMGELPSSKRLLNLKICDPAMGSGAFLVESCRFLADQVVAAWTREGVLDNDSNPAEVVMRARRLVAQRCLYGVDKNPWAVNLAKLSLWLVTLAKAEPFTFLDHALKCGDSLVGLSLEQIYSFNWKPGAQLELANPLLKHQLQTALKKREEILELAMKDQQELDPAKRKEDLLRDADEALATLKAVADACVGAFFAGKTDKEREKERVRRLDLISASLNTEGTIPSPLGGEGQGEGRGDLRPFHWPLEFPEVFHGQRPDPLDAEQVNKAAWMDGLIGNPPFLGGSAISSNFGDAYLDWLSVAHEGAHGNADLAAHFFRRAVWLLGDHGTVGFIATNTIAQGDTRQSGLKHVVDGGAVIYDAVKSMKWPVGGANVAVSVVNLAKGHVAELKLESRLDGQPVAAINSRLRGGPEQPDPVPLEANDGRSFLGAKIYGQGFVLSPSQRAELIKKDKANGERIFRYTGGEEINSDPDPRLERYVINFGDMELVDAEKWPELISIVHGLVKPERDALKDNADGRRRKALWWQFGRATPALDAATKLLKRSLAISRVSKHCMFSFQRTGTVFSEQAIIFPVQDSRWLTVLQSRVHEVWARLLSSSMRTDLRYAPSDCFETFPFPPRPAFAALDALGDRLHEVRSKYLTDNAVGLTTTYNRLKDEGEQSPELQQLRALHEEVDRAVLAAYGWSDITVPPYCAPSPAQWSAFEDAVLDRLFALNAERAAEEQRAGLAAPPPEKKKKAPAKKKAKA